MDEVALTSLAPLVGQVGLPVALLLLYMTRFDKDIKKLLITQAKMLTLLCILIDIDERKLDITK